MELDDELEKLRKEVKRWERRNPGSRIRRELKGRLIEVAQRAAEQGISGKSTATRLGLEPSTMYRWLRVHSTVDKVEGMLREMKVIGPDAPIPTPMPHTPTEALDQRWPRLTLPGGIASTVDQVGSRLLFRGYGVSESMRPVHAGVLARDTLYLLDEVHLATAFEETLGRLEHVERRRAAGASVGRRLHVVRMSATPRMTADSTVRRFGLDDEDRAHPVLAQRLGASRPAALELVKTRQGSSSEIAAINAQRVAEAVCARALEAIAQGARAVGVVVNRVDTARRAASVLSARQDVELQLLTGRMRPFEKGSARAAITRIAGVGVARDPDARPAVVVATSCIEAGADLDFDALVTEAASLDALRQRFGRVNRLGRHASIQAWILGRKDQIVARATNDPIYGAALRETWNYLQTIADDEQRVDFGLEAFPSPEPEQLASMLPAADEAPVLFPRYLDMWSETRPAPHPDPDVSLWLHGKTRRPDRDVYVVFRVDVPEASTEPDARERAAEALEFLPPVADEAVAVPLFELRSRLQERSVWRWSAEGLGLATESELGVGDTVVLEAAGGGLMLGTWDPRATEPVEDVAERASFAAHGIARLRLDPVTLPAGLRDGLPRPPEHDDPEALDQARRECLAWLDGIGDRVDALPESWRPLLGAIAASEGQRHSRLATSTAGARCWRVTVVPARRSVEATTEDGISSFAGVAIPLHDHLEDVEAWSVAFARTAGLEDSVAADVALAGLLHDLGKADRRFQAMLHGGDPISAAGGPLLAKSHQFGSALARGRAQQRSGWPRGMRHELISLALLDASEELRARAHDLDLVRHLVASHHGWCRPWAPAALDPQPQRVRVRLCGVDAEASTDVIDGELAVECASRFRRLCRRYGWHGLAYLEALLRLGDHRASAAPGARPGEQS